MIAGLPYPASLSYLISHLPSLICSRTLLHSTLYIHTISNQAMNRVSATLAGPFQSTASRSTTSKYPSILHWLWPRRVSLTPLDYGFQVWTIMSSQHISILAQSQPQSASLSSLNHSLPVRKMVVSKCIFTLAWLWSMSALLSSVDDSLQVYLQPPSITASNFAPSWPICAFLHSHHYRLDDHIYILSIVIRRCSTNYSQVPSAARLTVFIYIEWLR